MDSSIINTHEEEFSKIVQYFKEEISGLRTGRATPALVDKISIEVYGTRTPLLQLASITTPDPKTILIEPWDKNIVKEIEKSIQASKTNFNPTNEGPHLRISLPSLTEENRQELLKLLNRQAEDARRKIRNLRDKIREQIVKAERDKEITEDEKYKLQDELDKRVGEYNEQIKAVAGRKEEEIKTI